VSKPKKIVLKDGTVRYRIVTDAGRDPVTRKRRQLTQTFDKKKDADAELARISHQRATGTYVAPSKLTVAQMIDGYLASAAFEREAATKRNYECALVVPRERLGDRLAQSVTREDIEALRDFMLSEGRKRGDKRGPGLSSRSVRNTIGRLSAAFEQAVDDGKLTKNPCNRVRLPKLVKKEKNTWSGDEARQFLAVASRNRLHVAWRLALYGARREEICGARWEDIDLAARTWTISVVRVLVGTEIIEKEPKTPRSARTLPLDDGLVAALTALRTRQKAEALAAGPAYSASGYVVVDELGAPIRPDWLSFEFGRVVRRAGVRRITIHECRHTAISLMEKAGVPPSIISAWAGHGSPAFTYREYVHAGDDLTAGRDALSGIYSAGEAM
jgi:integrase